MFWGRRVAREIDPTRTIGVELNASIIRSACWGPEGLRQIPLQPPAEEMPLCVALHQRHLLYGQAAQAVARTMPHAICDNFLPSLGHSQQWRFGRHCLTAESALETILLHLRPVWEAQAAPLAVAVPAYLSAGQVQGLARLFRRMDCTLRAVLLAPLGVAAAFAPALYSHLPSPTQNTSKTLVQTNQPARDLRQAPITVGIVDVDAFALSAAVVGLTPDTARLLAFSAWPRLGLSVWYNRVLDAVADHCIRLCRRDPRDWPEAEQGLFEQLPYALEQCYAGQTIRWLVRTDEWYQELHMVPEELEGYCASLAQTAEQVIRQLTQDATNSGPLRALWMTSRASRLPGLNRQLQWNKSPGTRLEILSPSAIAQAAATLTAHWPPTEQPMYLDGTISLSVPGRLAVAGHNIPAT
ncbi:hypothetical protein [Thermogemmata fonticola]|uniref:Uncharacterized protein n=1 Tax=Thermogemmata fonticola TaxID=2755323 RepID=A0A7V8VFK0_9BACT|nr:hypothetical protein [Thermogemmata fonticola]MBA2227036.1 hypothetical protein [Thermogemmata fonticola]